MKQSDFLKARDLFNSTKDVFAKNREKLYNRRDEFVKYFTPEFISRMQYEDFAIGMERDKVKFNFCYSIEREFEDLGYIYGSNSFKFGFYYGRTTADPTVKFRYPQKFGKDENYVAAFNKIKETLLHLIEHGARENYIEIQKNKFSPMFQGKILSIFYPDKYLNVFAPDHLDHFLDHFLIGRTELKSKDNVYKRLRLQEFKNGDPIMKDWSNDMFSYFLYNEYPGGPPNNNSKEVKRKQSIEGLPVNFDLSVEQVFPEVQTAEFIELDLNIPVQKTTSTRIYIPGHSPRRNYEAENKRLKTLGDKGEEIVWKSEKARLIALGMTDVITQMDWPGSRGEDHLGFDILSYDRIADHPTEIKVEVKSTTYPPTGDINFYFTDNEYQLALSNENYYLYIVFEVASAKPKILRIKDPFGANREKIELIPIQYKARIKIKKSKK